MAKSLSTKLKDIKRIEDKAKKELERVKQETEKLVTPTRGKLESVFKERIDKFVRENLEEVISMKIDKSTLSREIDELLFRNVFGRDISEENNNEENLNKNDQKEDKETSKVEKKKSSAEDDLMEDSKIYLNN